MEKVKDLKAPKKLPDRKKRDWIILVYHFFQQSYVSSRITVLLNFFVSEPKFKKIIICYAELSVGYDKKMTQYTCSKRAVDLWERVFGEETLFSRYYNQQILGQGRTDILKYFTYAVFKSSYNYHRVPNWNVCRKSTTKV